MDHAARKRLYNRLNPDEPLDPTDPRNVDIDKLPGDVRGGNFVENLERKLLFSELPGCTVVTAQRGAGLTTELRRLGAKLSAQDGARWVVVHIAAQDVVDLSSPLQSADLLFAIWAHTEQVVANAVGKRMSDQTRRHLYHLRFSGKAAWQQHREIVDEAFQNNVILRYQNDDSWEDLHPALHEMEQIKLEVEKLKKQRKDSAS